MIFFEKCARIERVPSLSLEYYMQSPLRSALTLILRGDRLRSPDVERGIVGFFQMHCGVQVSVVEGDDSHSLVIMAPNSSCNDVVTAARTNESELRGFGVKIKS